MKPKPTGTEASVCEDIASRQKVGLAKYGTSVADNPLTLREWLWHAYEESLDQSVYLRRAIAEIDQTRGNEVDVALGCLRVLEAWASGIGAAKNPKAAKMARRAILALSATKTCSMAKNAVAGQKKAKAGFWREWKGKAQ